MKFCNKCGSKITNMSKFCTKCGVRLDLKSTNEKNTHINDLKDTIDEDIQMEKENYKLENIKSPQDTKFIDKNFNSKKQNIKRRTKYNKLVISFLIIFVLILGGGIFLAKNYILYNFYYAMGDKKTNINDKVSYYCKAIALEYDSSIVDNIYTLLKDDINFETTVNNLSNLKSEDKKNLIFKICVYKADKAFDNENYKKTLNYLNIADRNGYNIKNFPRYNELMEKTQKKNQNISDNIYSKTFKDIKEKTTSSNSYIISNSNSTYLDESDLKVYTKETLALIRNEIYARHGYIFQTEPFKTYFNSKSWYYPNHYFKGSDEELNNYEIKNVELIKKLENQI